MGRGEAVIASGTLLDAYVGLTRQLKVVVGLVCRADIAPARHGTSLSAKQTTLARAGVRSAQAWL